MHSTALEKGKRIYIETYGCQMNFSDSEIIASIMKDKGYFLSQDPKEADAIFINTCSIRDHAEQRILNRLRELKALKKKNNKLVIGVLGCMAERLKEQIIEQEKIVDIVAGPDSYRQLPSLLQDVEAGQKGINTLLSEDETYTDIIPVRYAANKVSAFISIMRGCQNYCSYCVVPFTRGKERSRNAVSIVDEASGLFDQGYREITLLGQNVNSYLWKVNGSTLNFAGLLEQIASVNPLLRLRFATSHPKDLSDELLQLMASYENICRSVHLPVQSGSSRILALMNRKYSREWYMNRIEAIHSIIKVCSVSTDIITGFCTETEKDHRETLSLMEWAKFDFAYMFKYSERPDTLAAKKYPDDVPEEVKSVRLKEIIALQQKLSYNSNKKDTEKVFSVLAEGVSKRSGDHLFGRNSQNKVVVFPKNNHHPGDYVNIRISHCTPATLIGTEHDIQPPC